MFSKLCVCIHQPLFEQNKNKIQILCCSRFLFCIYWFVETLQRIRDQKSKPNQARLTIIVGEYQMNSKTRVKITKPNTVIMVLVRKR